MPYLEICLDVYPANIDYTCASVQSDQSLPCLPNEVLDLKQSGPIVQN